MIPHKQKNKIKDSLPMLTPTIDSLKC